MSLLIRLSASVNCQAAAILVVKMIIIPWTKAIVDLGKEFDERNPYIK